MAEPLIDGFGRRFSYLRLSVDDACNFRCVYCLPDGHKKTQEDPPLSAEEIGRLVRAFAQMGFWKVRLTGGEPTVRRDILEIARSVAATPGVERVALSTNGYRLAELAEPLAAAGVAAVNVSLDSLDRARFAAAAGVDKLDAVWAGVEASLAAGLETKLNAVLLKGLNDGELEAFFALTRERPLSVRFIELMPTADNVELFQSRRLSAETALSALRARGWAESPRQPGQGPARVFAKPGHRGSVGVIAPYAKDFCQSCNRLRVNARGGLRLCLFAEGDASLRPWLRRDDQLPELQARVRELVLGKSVSHDLPSGRFGDTKHFAMIGG